MIIDYTIHGTLQLQGEDPLEAVRNLTPLALENIGEKKAVEFFIDGNKLPITWDLPQVEWED